MRLEEVLKLAYYNQLLYILLRMVKLIFFWHHHQSSDSIAQYDAASNY